MGSTEYPPAETALTGSEVAFRQHRLLLLRLQPRNQDLTASEVAFRQHRGGHTSGPNWPMFLEFAARYLHAPEAAVYTGKPYDNR